ncbi:MAG: hypothetical protein HY209_01160 [Candidatus Omnitrophica bacterium]|nr:hypothetical protein [Candidatus Omnitrophota bacterium]
MESGHHLAKFQLWQLTNKFLAVSLVLLSLYFVYGIFFLKPSYTLQGSVKSEVDPLKDTNMNNQPFALQRKDYSYYFDKISGRELFGQTQQTLSVDTATVDEATDNLKLVGIIAGKSPQAVVEDKKNEKTYYLNKGDSFEGLNVQEILDNKVILDHEGKKMALSL